VTNTSIIRDPVDNINVGTRITIPFQLTEADINCRVILLTDYPVVRLAVEMPNGNVIDETNSTTFGVTFKTNNNTKTSSFNLPLAFEAQAVQAGTWNAILEIDRDLYDRTLSILSDNDPNAEGILRGKGARYCLSMHSFSNLRMNASVTQNAYAPGSTLTLRALLNEYNLPIERRSKVRAELEYPDHTHDILHLGEIKAGVFETTMVANIPGIYRFNVVAKGVTYNGMPFTREQIFTAAIFRNSDIQPPVMGTEIPDQDDRLCRLVECLLKDESIRKFFMERGLNFDSMIKCLLGFFCEGRSRARYFPTRSVRDMFAEAKWSDLPSLMEAFLKENT
jgi:hypothetical protein